MTSAPHPHATRARRVRRALVPIVAGVASLAAVPAASAAAAERSPSTNQPLLAHGAGHVSGKLPFCVDGSPGPCGWVIEGSAAGTPIASGSFFAVIDDGNAATDDRCAPATFSGVLSAGPDDAITQSAPGRVCPDGAGGFRFAGRLDASTGTGRFADVSSGRALVLATIGAEGAARLTLAGHLRIG